MKREENSSGGNAGMVAVIFGILSIPGSFFPIIGLFFGVVGLIFGIVQFRSSSNKWAVWGIVLSAFGIVLSIAFFILAFKLLSNSGIAQQLQGLQPTQ